MSERQNGRIQLCFDASLNVDFQGSRVTSDGSLVLVRELDERLGQANSMPSTCGRNGGPWVYTVGFSDVKMEIPAK
jgi:hypothetical protein